MYKPEPIDISEIELSAELKEISERLSKNTHEIWSYGKLAAGWKYGDTVNSEKKEHPSLVPYEMLSESEKDYDRRTTIGTIKTLIAMGYTIKKLPE